MGFLLTGFISENIRDFGIHYKEKDVVEDNELRSPFEKRVQELIAQCKGIPPGEVMQLLLKADSNQDIDLEKELHELFKKYNDKKWNVKSGSYDTG